MTDYLVALEANPGVGTKIDPNQKPPIILPKMNRTHLVMLFHELGYTAGAEIGVSKGKYSAVLCEYNPKLKLYCIDSWRAYDGYQEEYTQAMMDAIYAEACARLEGLNCDIIKGYSMGAVGKFKDESLDFVYIDANHSFQHVTNDIAEWSKKVRPGGIVSGHDWTRYKRNPRNCHVKSVVNAWTYSYGIKPWFVLRGEHGASWFWIKR